MLFSRFVLSKLYESKYLLLNTSKISVIIYISKYVLHLEFDTICVSTNGGSVVKMLFYFSEKAHLSHKLHTPSANGLTNGSKVLGMSSFVFILGPSVVIPNIYFLAVTFDLCSF